MSPSPAAPTSASSERLTCRAFRATSDMPFLWSSSSSSVIIGRYTSCSSKRKSAVGSCMRTLVSSTNIFTASPCTRFRGRGSNIVITAGAGVGTARGVASPMT